MKDVQPLLEAHGVPALRHLGITNAEFTDELCALLPESKILPQLEELDLKMGTMGDEGAVVLADNAPRFRHLRQLNVDDNFISAEGEERLRAAFGKALELGAQRKSRTPEGRYASAYE